MLSLKRDLSAWKLQESDDRISSDAMYHSTTILKTFIDNLASVIPNMILNSVDCSDVRPHLSWDLSQFHNIKIKAMMQKALEI